jgi:type I restriction enzyme, S subunit
MKHSGIEWIGDIPSDWEIKKLKYVTGLRNEIGRLYNDDIYLGLENIESSTGKYIQTETEYDDGFYSIVKKGDVLFGKLRPYLEKVYMSDIDGFCSSEFVNFKEFNGEKRYLFYFLLSHGFIEIVNSSTYGAKMPRAEWEYIKNLNIPMSLLSEQSAIAAFLDTQCSKIDNIITELEHQIEILKQYKTSLITETVTKGLKKNVPMKNSGIDWIGKIPAHWEVGRIKDMMILQRGYDLSQDEFNDEEIPVYGSNGIIGYHNKITTKGTNVTIGRSGSVGEVNYVNTDAWIHNTAIFIYDMKNNDCRYLFYVLLSIDIKSLSSGSAVPTLDRKNIQNIKFVFTQKRKEQKAIAAFLDRKCKEITDIITEKQQSIDTMKAYKKSLIYEYVTGKKRVTKK